jgi:hypothetical protein
LIDLPFRFFQLFEGSWLLAGIVLTPELPVHRQSGQLSRGALVGGWQISNIWQAQIGMPFTPSWGGGGSNFSGSGTWYPNRICNGRSATHHSGMV